MKLPLHHFQLQSTPLTRQGEIVRAATRSDLHWNTPIFRAPGLPIFRHIESELPFTARFPRPTRVKP